MNREPGLYLLDILESIEKIQAYTKKGGKKSFLENPEKQDAVIRRLEIIGEAVKNLPDEIKKQNPETSWKKISGLRDILSHAYFGVNRERIWLIIKDDLPDLKKQIRQIIKTRK